MLQQEDDIVPIPGTRRRANLEQNAAAGAILSAAEIAMLKGSLSHIAGPR